MAATTQKQGVEKVSKMTSECKETKLFLGRNAFQIGAKLESDPTLTLTLANHEQTKCGVIPRPAVSCTHYQKDTGKSQSIIVARLWFLSSIAMDKLHD